MSKLDEALFKAYEQRESQSVPELREAAPSNRPPEAHDQSDHKPDVVANESPLEHDEPSSTFKPMLQVDAFVWPESLQSPSAQTEAELDDVAAALVGSSHRRPTVIGLAGTTNQTGCSTLLLGVAKRLTALGVNVALVDADENKAALGAMLGLLPPMGWEDIAAGSQPLAEVLIESIEDGLALLPLRDPGQLAQLSGAAENMQPAMTTLREHYDLVLVDLGSPSNWTSGAIDGAIDVTVLVHHAGRATTRDLQSACDQLAARHLACAGVIENFAPPISTKSYQRAA